MTRRTAALGALLLVAACHRSPTDIGSVADADAQHATAIRTQDDILAAEAAAHAPLPADTTPPAAPIRKLAPASTGEPADDLSETAPLAANAETGEPPQDR